MKTSEEKKKNLLEGLEDHKPMKIFLGNGYYDTFYYENGNYQGRYGFIKLEDLFDVLNGNLEHISLEIAND